MEGGGRRRREIRRGRVEESWVLRQREGDGVRRLTFITGEGGRIQTGRGNKIRHEGDRETRIGREREEELKTVRKTETLKVIE